MSSSIIGADYPFEYLHNEIVATLFTEADKSNTASTQNGKVVRLGVDEYKSRFIRRRSMQKQNSNKWAIVLAVR
jgi:hypothetical protein